MPRTPIILGTPTPEQVTAAAIALSEAASKLSRLKFFRGRATPIPKSSTRATDRFTRLKESRELDTLIAQTQTYFRALSSPGLTAAISVPSAVDEIILEIQVLLSKDIINQDTDLDLIKTQLFNFDAELSKATDAAVEVFQRSRLAP